LREWAEPDDSRADIAPGSYRGGAITDGGEAHVANWDLHDKLR
jgi:hypothetical protein